MNRLLKLKHMTSFDTGIGHVWFSIWVLLSANWICQWREQLGDNFEDYYFLCNCCRLLLFVMFYILCMFIGLLLIQLHLEHSYQNLTIHDLNPTIWYMYFIWLFHCFISIRLKLRLHKLKYNKLFCFMWLMIKLFCLFLVWNYYSEHYITYMIYLKVFIILFESYGYTNYDSWFIN